MSADGKTVYAAGFKTGNQTITFVQAIVTPEGGIPGANQI